MERPKVGIIIPAKNEGATIRQVVAGVLPYGTPIVVNDGSTDETGSFAAAAGADVVTHASNRGYDQALNSGFERAAELGCDYAITIDGDGQHEPGILGAFIGALDDGADVVIGVRDRRQRIAEVAFAFIGRRRWGIEDPLCGMKAYRMEVWREHGCFDSYSSIGSELAIFAASSGKQVTQLPVKTRDRLDAPRFGRRFDANKRIFRALFKGVREFKARP